MQPTTLEAAELPADGLDGAYARWVLSFVPDLDAFVGRIAEVLRPGGRLAAFDYLNWPALTWGPRAETLPTIRAAILGWYAAHGADPSPAHRAPAALGRAGLEVEEMTPVVRLIRPREPLWRWPQVWLDTFLPSLVARGLLRAEDFEAWQAEWAVNRRDPAGFFVTPTQVEIVARAPEA